MENTGPFVWYGTFMLLVTGSLIAIPYLRRKSDLLTGWNLLLLGCGLAMGLGCFEAVATDARWDKLKWFYPTKGEVSWWMLASFVFMVGLIASHYYNPLNAIPKKCLQKWPPETTSMFLAVISCCFAVVFASLVTMGVPFFGNVFIKLAQKAIPFAAVFSFVLWFRNRTNPFWLALFCAVFLWAALASVLAGGGRRMLLSVIVGPVLYLYWAHARYWNPKKTITLMALAAVPIFMVLVMYSSIRHFDRKRGQERTARTASAVLESVKSLSGGNWLERFTQDKLLFFAQRNVHYSLLIQRYVSTGELEAKPLNTLAFLASYPIPRRFWSGKPEIIGLLAVRKIVGLRTTSWGVGIPGHGAYEGGVIVLLLYGALAGFAIRFFDDPLLRQPTNPFLIATLATAGPHILAWPRGDLGVMTVEAGQAVLFAIVAGILCRFMFGTARAPAQQPPRGRSAYQANYANWKSHAG